MVFLRHHHGRPRVPGAIFSVLVLLLAFLLAESIAEDYTVSVSYVQITGVGCMYLNDGQGEQYSFLLSLPGTQVKCWHYETHDDSEFVKTVQWDFDITTTKSSVVLSFEAFEKDGQGDVCTYEGADDEWNHITADQSLALSSLSVDVPVQWYFKSRIPNTQRECYLASGGTYRLRPSDQPAGSPRINSTSLAIVNNELQLTITGKELNPDPEEPPVVQIFGVETGCKSAGMSISSTKITCTLTRPESDRVSNLAMQVQVQTSYGVTRQATIAFPTCTSPCQNNGTCWWSQDFGKLECVCSSFLYYGDYCQNKYPDGVPIVHELAPIGGDYTKDIVIAVAGRAYPQDDDSITAVVCELSWTGNTQKVVGNTLVDERDVAWSGPLQPYKGENIPQADSLQLVGLCRIPGGTFEAPTPAKRRAQVTVIWQRNATGESIRSQQKKEFMLYGPLHVPSSSAKTVSNPVDGDMRVFRDQMIQVSLSDAQGNLRVGGEDSDVFFVNWHGGPSTDPRFGIKGGDAKSFKYSKCRANPDDATCAYYEIKVSFDFSGDYKANVYTTDRQTLNLATINQGDLIFSIKGFGEATLPVPANLPSSISWADQLKDRQNISIFDKGLAQLISPNTGARDRSNVLGPLFQRWKGGWFTQRQTVSLAFESALSQATFGSVHVIRSQGTEEPFFCDTHTDELEAGPLATTLVPWEATGNVPAAFPLIGLAFTDGDCLTSLMVTIELVHRDPNSVGLTLTRKGLASTSPRAKNTTTTVVLKQATTSTAPLGDGIPSPVVLRYNMQTTAGLAGLKGLPALADWTLTATGPTERGHIKSWYIDANSEYCLKSTQVDNTICGEGGGQLYARAANVDDRLVLECPQGGVITKIQWARFGKLEGSCDEGNVQVLDGCEANTTIVKQRVESVCVGHTSCELMALDTQFAVEIGEPFLCPGELPPCPDDASLVVADDVLSTQTKRGGRRLPRNSAELERRLPLSYPGTEDHYYKSTHVRHVAEPLFRPRRSDAEPVTCTYSSVRPKKALMVQALCEDTNAAFKARDSPPVEKKMLMTSVSADFDNDWKDETLTLYGYEGGSLHASFTYIEAGKPRTQVYKSLTIGGVPIVLAATGGQLSMQTGDFDSDGYPEVVFGFIDGPTGKLRLILWDLDIDNTDTWHALAKESRSNLQACGCFDKTNIIPLIFDGASELTVPSEPTLPVRLTDGRRTDSPGFSFALAAGDIGMFGFDTFAVAWIDDSASVAWSLYQRNEEQGIAPVLAEPIRLRSLKHPHAVSLNLANYDGSGMCELALGIVDDTDAKVYLYTIDQLEEGFPMKQTKVISVNPSSVDNIDGLWGADPQFMQRINLQMVSGDLDDDGDAEIIVAYTASGVAHITRIDAPGTGTKCRRVDCMEMFGQYTSKLSLGGSTGVQKRSPEIKLAIGNIDDSSANELLVAVEYQSTVYSDVAKVMLTSLTAQPNKDYPFSINGRHCYAGPYYQENEQAGIPTVNNMALTVGNLYGLGFRVGEPSTIRYEGVPELIAVINAPPTHYDITDDGGEIIVNPGTFHGGGSFAELSNVEGIVSSFDITRETASASTTSHGFQLNAKVAVVFGNVDLAWKDFTSNSENTGFAHTEQIAVSRDVVAAGDDSVLYMSTDKDVWKYPIIDQSGNQVGSLDITLSSSCGENCVQKADGRDLWWYTPEHELFNILTYSSRAPIDFNPVNRIMVGEKVALGPNAHEQWVDQQAGKSQNKISLNHTTSGKGAGGGAGIQVGVDYNFAASFMGVGPQIKLPIGINVMAGYAGRTESTKDGMYAVTQSANINRDASVHCYLESISPLHAYKVQPFVYMASSGSKEYLKLDYTVEPGFYPGVSSWWQRTYNKPDPTFNMPWWWTTFKRDRTMLTKEIVATPAFPKLGETVQVTVTVRNKALVQANNVPVTLWRGNPENCLDLDCLFPGRTLIGAIRINLIPAQDKREVSFLLKYDGTHNIHATIDDRNDMAETHEGNNHGYNLLFHNLRDEGYTLQSLNLENTLLLKPVKGTAKGGKRYTQGYDVAMTILGDTFTRQNVLVQLWHGAVGGSGRLLTTINVPRVRGSVGGTVRYTLSAYWDTRNAALYGKQELHAVILHSGFDTSPDNIVAHVSQTVTVDCFGEVDMCGVCRGDNTRCAGCDGVPLSGKTVDVCGKCGGDGSTCCVRKPSQATTHYIKLTNDPSASNNKRVKVGDLVVWENLLDWNVLISGGVFSYAGAPTFGLSALQQNGFPIQGAVPPMTLDDETVNAYVQQYLSILTTKDIVEATGSAPSVPTPVPDSTTKYLRRSAEDEYHHHHSDDNNNNSNDDEEDILGLSRFPGFRVSAPTQRVAEARLQNIREAYQQHRCDQHSFADYDDPYYAEMAYGSSDFGNESGDDDEELQEEDIFMDGICCAPEDEDLVHGRRNGASSRVSRLPPDHDYDLHQHELVRQAHARGLVQARVTAATAKRHTKPSFSLRSLTLSILQHQTKQKDVALLYNSSSAIAMDDHRQLAMGGVMKRRDASSSASTYYDVRSHEQVALESQSLMGEEADRVSLRRARCLCPVRAAGSSHSRRLEKEPAKPAEPEKAEQGQSAETPAKTDPAGDPKPSQKDAIEEAEANGEASMGSGELGTPDVGVGSSMSGATSFGVVTFSGFGPARGWSLYDFGEFTKAAAGDPAVMAPGAASAPHRFFSPGIYVWHDSNNPVLHGVVIVDPSDLVTDVCGICGGDGKSCLDCKNKPFGTAVRDVCGVCYDPLFDDYDPSKARDCAGVCNGTAKIDECGYCAGGSTGLTPGFAKDCSGQCNGTTPSYCGVCGASQATHSFLADCAGECGGPRVTNKCGYCVGGDTGLDALHGMDCLGSCGGTAVRDCRGECQGLAKIDCAGVCGGSARINNCYRCVNGSAGLDDAQTKTCDGVCAVAPLTPCGTDAPSPQSRDFGYDSFEELKKRADERACSGGLVADRQGTCCDPGLIDCTNLCRGSASVVCGVCVGGSSGTDASEVRDCKGVCNGTATYNPCGVCTTPEEYYNGTNYYVDCANVCSGSAYVDSCGVCVEGSTGVAANSTMDCQGTCNGTAIRDDCGVCYRPGDGLHVHNSGMDCAGVCNGTAVRDDCNSCVLGTTRREFNADKDCAGQCFGQHVASDPACTCPAGQLDQCFVCGGNNTQCAGCDGIPWSNKTRDFCGVCGGNNTACCFLPFAQTTATIKNFESIVLRHTLETGETLAITNLHDGYAYSIIMYRLDVPADVARVKQIQTRWDYATLRPGNTLNIIIREPGLYRLTSIESSSITFELRVSYNTKLADVCGRCVYPAETTSTTTAASTTIIAGGKATSNSSVTITSRDQQIEYDHCCKIMPTNNVHDWFQTTYYYELLRPEQVTRVVPFTASYAAAATEHRVRLLEPQTIDSSAWWHGKILAVGDVVVLENRDTLDHVVSFSGPQPVPDVLLNRGTTIFTPPFLKPGTYRLQSNKNLINTTFTVAFGFSCSVYSQEAPPPAEDDHTLLVVLTTTLGGSFLVLVALILLIAGAAALAYKCSRPNKVETHAPSMYPL